jgi:hypothetical protein
MPSVSQTTKYQMFHGLDNRFLYVAYRVVASFADDIGNHRTYSGTGFFVTNSRSQVCFVTNRHVLDLAYVDPQCAKFALTSLQLSGKAPAGDDKSPVVDQSIEIISLNVKFSTTYENDVACVVEPSVRGTPSSHVEWFIPYGLLAKAADFQSKLSICDFLAFPGFPPWYDHIGDRPILRTGTVASDPRFEYSWTDSFKGQCLAYEAFSFGGSSGSPVFAVQKGPKPGAGISFSGFRELMMIGINAGHLPAENRGHSGISYLYKSSAIVDLIDRAG